MGIKILTNFEKLRNLEVCLVPNESLDTLLPFKPPLHCPNLGALEAGAAHGSSKYSSVWLLSRIVC